MACVGACTHPTAEYLLSRVYVNFKKEQLGCLKVARLKMVMCFQAA